MKTKLTNSIVEKLQPGPKYFDVLDTEVSGLAVRVEVSGKKIYRLRYKLPDGTRRVMRIGDASAITVAQARDAANLFWADAVRGDDPLAAKQQVKTPTLKAFLPVYKERAPKARAAANNVKRVEGSFKDLLDTPLDAIKPMRIENRQASRQRDGIKGSTVNREVTALRAVLSKAVDWGYIDKHPLRRVKQLREDKGTRPRYLKPDELKWLYAALDARESDMRDRRERFNKWRKGRSMSTFPDLKALPFADYLKPLVLLALNTGLRRGELFNLAWADCELEGDAPSVTVQGETAKSGKTRHIPLNRTALDVLKRWKSQGEGAGLVFVSPKTGGRFDNINKAWDQLTKDAKLPDFRFHDTRHHFASMLVQKGIDLNTVRELLGHGDLKLTMRYAYLAPENTARAVAVLDEPVNIVSLEKRAEK